MRRGVAIVTVAIYLVMMLGGLAYGSETDVNDTIVIELTLDQAVDKALATSKDLKQSDYDIERGEKVREKVADTVKYIPIGPSPEAASAAFTTLVQTDLAWQMSKKTKTMKADAVVLSVFQAYTNVLSAQEEVTAAEAALKNADWQQRAARASYQVGMSSEAAKIQAEAGYQLRKAALEAARQGLIDKYQALNNIVGLKPDDRPVLLDIPQFIPIEIDNLEAAIQRRLEQSPSIWLADRKVELAKLDLDLYDWTNPMREPYDAKKIDVSTAELTAADGKEQMRQAIRAIYNKILQLEENYALQQENLKIAEENLRIVQVQFEVGMATKAQLLEAESQVAEAKKSLASTIYTHEVLKLQFDKPWAAATA
jgi:outer membrane protein